MNLVITIALLLIVLAFIIFPDFRKKLKVLCGGFLNIFVEDVAKTPEGAEAVFNQAIAEVQEQYNKASNTLNRLAGEKKHAEDEIGRLTKEIQSTEATCEKLVKANELENAKVYSQRRSDLLVELEQKKQCVDRLTPMVNDATEMHEALGKKLMDLKRKRKEVVGKLKMNGQLKELLGDLDELKRDTATSKMLEAVMDGSTDLQKDVDGARVVHENRTSTKIARAEAKAKQVQTDDYLESLKKKYNGGR